MSEREKEILQKLGSALPTIGEDQKEYLLGVADGIALMSDSKQQKEREERSERCSNG